MSAYDLLDKYMTECVLMNLVSAKSPSGGYYETYTESDVTFQAAVEITNSLTEETAMKDGVKGIYEVHFKKPMRLPFHAVFKRYATDEVEEKMFRVTSLDEEKTPKSSPLNLRVVRAEEFVPPPDEPDESEDDDNG